MSFRLVPCLLVLSSSVAAADSEPTPAGDEVVLTPVCAEIDATRDTFGETERELARAQLVRVLQDADLLVVERDCVERYVLSHEQRDGDFVVRLTGPGGVRRVRNPERAELQTVYDRMLTALIDAQEEAAKAAASAARDAAAAAKRAEVATIEPTDSTYEDATTSTDSFDAVAPDEPSAVRGDMVFYGQLVAGSAGSGAGVGLRIPTSRARAIDLSFVGAGSLVAVGAELLHFAQADAPTSVYVGGGLSYAEQSAGYMEEATGARLEGTAGVMFNRTGSTRMFLQADLGLPLYSLAGGYSPTFMVSLGVGQ